MSNVDQSSDPLLGLAGRVRDLERASRRGRFREVIYLALAVAIVPTFAVAVDPPPGVLPFESGSRIVASDLSELFDRLYEAVTDLETTGPVYVNPDTGKTYSTLATPCGDSGTTTANIGSPATVKTLCEAACSSSSAHICTTDELMRYVETGGQVATTGWVSNDFAQYYASSNNDIRQIDNCHGWSTASDSVSGTRWAVGSTYPARQDCARSTPALCCN